MGPILEVNKPMFLSDRCKGYAMAHTNKSHIVHVNGINIVGRAKPQSKNRKEIIPMQDASRERRDFTCAAYCRNQPVGGKITQAATLNMFIGR